MFTEYCDGITVGLVGGVLNGITIGLVLGCIFLLERNELEGHRGKEFLGIPFMAKEFLQKGPPLSNPKGGKEREEREEFL